MNSILIVLSFCLLSAGGRLVGRSERHAKDDPPDGSTNFSLIIPSGDSQSHSQKMIGGEKTEIEKHPYQVQLFYFHILFICGGSILNENTILTAAHCVHGRDFDHLSVAAGSTYSSLFGSYEVSKVYKHEDFTYNEDDYFAHYDVAILKLEQNLLFSNKIKPIKLRSQPVPEGAVAVTTGWGQKSLNSLFRTLTLRQLSLEVLSNEECGEMFGEGFDEITDDLLCAFSPGKSTCYGDAGGPLVVDDELIGVVSNVLQCDDDPIYPVVFANVSHIRDFIEIYM